MRHLDEAVSKATVIDFTHIEVLVHPLVKRQLVTVITCDRTHAFLVVIPATLHPTGIVLFELVFVTMVPTGRGFVVALGEVETFLTHEVNVINASAVATALPVDVDTRVFPWVNLAVLVQVFYCV